MISKFKNIKNLAVFNNFDWDSSVLSSEKKPLSFGKINIIYGQNYSGKTTLSRILQAFENRCLPKKYDSPEFSIMLDDGNMLTQANVNSECLDIRVFNEDFIKTNLRFLIDPEAEICPFAILGSGNNILEKEIQTLIDEIGIKDIGSETGLYKELSIAREEYKKVYETYKKFKKGLDVKLQDKATNKKIGIKYNYTQFGDFNYNITKLQNDINTVLLSKYVPLSSTEKTNEKEIVREQIKDLVPDFNWKLENFDKLCQYVTTLLKRRIGASNKITKLLSNIALNEWVRKGAELHKDRNICEFCGNQISDERWEIIHAHFDEESKKLEDEIDKLIKTLEAEKEHILLALNINKNIFYSTFHNRLDTLAKDLTSAVSLYQNQINSIIEQLKNKKANLINDLVLIIPEDHTDKLTKAFNDYKLIIKDNNDYSVGLDKTKKLAQEKLRLQEVYDFCITINYQQEMEEIELYKGECIKAEMKVKKIEEELNKKEKAVQDKRRQMNDEEEGARRVNKYLNYYFGHNFVSLQAEKVEEDEKRICFRIIRNGKPAYNLSEGECSLIAFCYFIAKLEEVENQGKKPIIWIDDPISSLDANHVFFVYSMILAEIVKKENWSQLFLSTHNLDFLKYLRRLNGKELKSNGKNGSIEKVYFVVQRHGIMSEIKKMPHYLKEYATEYNYLFSMIWQCSNIEIIDDNNYKLLYNFGNTVRRFFEIHLYFKYPDASDSDSKLRKFFGADEISAELIIRFYNECSHGSLERAQRVGELPEAITVAKKIIDKLKEDKDQYDSLMKSIINNTII